MWIKYVLCKLYFFSRYFHRKEHMIRLNSGIRNCHFFFGWAFFCFKKLEVIQWIMVILGISKFWFNSLGIWFWNFPRIFENAWVALICLGVSFWKSPDVLTLIRWSFWYIKLAVLIWFHLNPRNFNPRNFWFLVGFSFKTIFAPSPTTTTFISKDAELSCTSFDTCERFAASCPLT